jgi:hypothetical protein
MKIRFSAGLAVGLAAAALAPAAASAAGPATVHVRAEGPAATVVPRTQVTTTTAAVNKDGQAGHDCTGTSAAGALERATAGDWAGTWYDGLGYAVDRIRAEASDPTGTYWALWINYRYSDVGVCGAELQAGDDVLLVMDCFYTGCVSPKPLRLSRVPATAAPGSSADVLVETFEHAGFPSVTQAVPAAGATVSVGGRGFTTGADGIAHVTFTGSGAVAVQATEPQHVRSAVEATCVTTGADGACGTRAPQRSAPDTTAPLARIDGIRDGQRFSRRRAPRELHGSVTADPSGLWAVKIRLTRRLGETCWYFSGTRERFLKRTCGKQYAFRVGDREQWSYLLPSRLPRGRYVLSAYAIDNAFNHGTEDRVRFRVR